MSEVRGEEAGVAQRGNGLVEQVMEHLRDHVAARQLRPGARLPSETALSAQLGVSRPVVREAMRTLAATGLVETAVGKRATIIPVDGEMLSRVIGNAVLIGQADTRNILEMRRGIEIAMVELAARRRTDAELAQLREISAEMVTQLANAERYTELDLSFHMALAEATHNPLYGLLIEAFRHLFASSMLTGMARWSATPELRHVQDLHDEIVDRIAWRDPRGASAAMARHFDEALATILSPDPPGAC